MEDEGDDEAAEGQQHDQDQEEEEDDEGEDTESVKTYVKSIISFDDDDERNPNATSSPKGNITIMLQIFQSYCSLCYKGAKIINCIFSHFSHFKIYTTIQVI